MKKLSLLVVFAVATLGGSSCLTSRVMKSVVQSGDKNVTLVQSYDTYTVLGMFPWAAKHQFWKCNEAPGSMTCAKVCDVDGSDLVCPAIGAASTINSVQ